MNTEDEKFSTTNKAFATLTHARPPLRPVTATEPPPGLPRRTQLVQLPPGDKTTKNEASETAVIWEKSSTGGIWTAPGPHL